MGSNGLRNNHIVRIRGLSKTYRLDCESCTVLNHVSLDVAEGQFVVLLGASGSGKSTLLNLISGIDNCDEGQIVVNGTDIVTLNEHQRTIFRRDHIGFVFQFFNLITTLTVLENITLPLDLRGTRRSVSEPRAMALLDRVGLADRASDFPDKLSGGEQQRVAIARALIHEPALVLADEPTGNLDRETGRRVMALLLELTREAGKTLIMATHDSSFLQLSDSVFQIRDGSLYREPAHEPALTVPTRN